MNTPFVVSEKVAARLEQLGWVRDRDFVVSPPLPLAREVLPGAEDLPAISRHHEPSEGSRDRQ